MHKFLPGPTQVLEQHVEQEIQAVLVVEEDEERPVQQPDPLLELRERA